MTQEEFARWQAITMSSSHRWVEDAVTRLNGRGLLYYSGGETGTYMRITPDGKLQAGTYEDAYPHIGEASFILKAEKECGSFNEAFKLACEVGGKKFLMDMFAGDHLPQTVETVEPGNQTQGPVMKM